MLPAVLLVPGQTRFMCWWYEMVTRGRMQDQVARDAGLAFRGRACSLEVDVPGSAAAAPLGGPVGVQIDAAAVLPLAVRAAVGVQDGDDPEVGVRARMLECGGDGEAGALGAVDAAEDEPRVPCGLPATGEGDRPAMIGAADESRSGRPATLGGVIAVAATMHASASVEIHNDHPLP